MDGKANFRDMVRRVAWSADAIRACAPASNRLLSALSRDGWQRLLDAGLEPVTLSRGEVLYEPGEAIRHVHFPQQSVVSLLMLIDGHPAAEVGLVGREGMVGLPVALGIRGSPVRALVQEPGTAMRMASAPLRKQLQENRQLQRELHRFRHALMTQVMQTSACHHFHMLEQRLARELLMTRDRVLSDEFHLTHESLAEMLGVRRAGVTLAACALQRVQLIAYNRGDIRILDPKGLEAAACRCYTPLDDAQALRGSVASACAEGDRAAIIAAAAPRNESKDKS
jgi:CRP-like cAMP-binding protein